MYYNLRQIYYQKRPLMLKIQVLFEIVFTGTEKIYITVKRIHYSLFSKSKITQ